MAKIKLNKVLQNSLGGLAKKVAFIVIPTILVAGFVYFTGHNFNFVPASLAGAEHNLSGFAWSETIGWISFNSKNCDGNADGFSDGGVTGCPLAGAPVSNYGVNINQITGDLSGFAWSENIGWIQFNPTGPYPSAPDNSAKLNTTTNQITGWARACAGTVSGDCTGASRTDGWDGWIKMSGAASNGSSYGVIRSSGANCGLSGFAWGSDVVGWISFKGIATDGSPYGVSSAFCESEPPRELCEESTSDWGECQCSKEKKERTLIRQRSEDPYQCYSRIEEQDCSRQEKNSCRDFNFREVAP